MRRVAHKMNAQEYLKEHPEILLTDEEIDKNWDSELLSEDLWSDILLHSKTIAKAQYEKAYPKILAEGKRQAIDAVSISGIVAFYNENRYFMIPLHKWGILKVESDIAF